MTDVNFNSLLMILGWVGGAMVIVLGMRGKLAAQIEQLTGMRGDLTGLVGRVSQHDQEIAYLRGKSDGRREVLDTLERGKA